MNLRWKRRIGGRIRTFPTMRRAATTAVAVGALVSLGLAGCGGGGGSTSSDGGSATQGNVTWWSWTPDNDLAAREIAAFNKQYPQIKVTYKKVPIDNYAALLRPALASKDGPDVYTVNASGSFSAQTFAPYAYDLTPDVKKLLGDDWQSKVYAAGAKAFTVKDRLVAAQFAKVGAGIVWINKGTFDKYKVKPPTTMDEWVSVCKTFRANGLGCLREGLAGTAGFVIDTLHSIADSVEPGAWTGAISGQKKWTDPGMVQSLQILQTMSKNGILDEGAVGIQQYPDVNNAFLTGKVPMVQMGTWYQQYATVNSLTAALQGAGVPTDTKKITILPAPFPDVAGKGNPPPMYADPDAGNSVNAKSKVRNAAVTFALWLGHTKEGQQVVADNMDSFPTLNGVGPNFDNVKLVDPALQRPALEDVSKRLGEATEARSFGISAQVSQALIDACQAVVSGKSPSDAAAAIQSVADSEHK
jgi:raffinose/stachyose/melibiose transport system substrate-binding protein